MVHPRADVHVIELLADLLDLLARGAVDQRRSAIRECEQRADALKLVALGAPVEDLKEEVWALKAVDEDVGLGQVELGEDVALDLACGGGGQRDGGGVTELLAHLAIVR